MALIKVIPLGICTVCYTGQAIYFAVTRDWPGAMIFTGYAFANVGLMIAL